MNQPFKITHILLVFILSFLSTGFLQGQKIEVGGLTLNNSADSSKTKKMVAIPLTQIPAKLEEADDLIKTGEKKALPKKNILLIDSLLPIYKDFLIVQKKKSQEFIKANPNRQKIDNLINKWQGYSGQLNIWQQNLNDLEDKNMDVLVPFNDNEYLWAITLESAKNENAPPSIINNIERTIKEISNIKNSIVDENNRSLTLETEIIHQKTVVNSTIEELNFLKNSDVYHFLYQRHKPLWKASYTLNAASNEEKEAIESMPNNFNGIIFYISENVDNIYSYLILVSMLIIMILYFKRSFIKVKFTDEVASFQHSKQIIIDHTISAIFFISFVLFLIFFDSIPFLLRNIITMLALISAIPILQSEIYNRFEKSLYFIIGFYVLNSAKTFIWFSSTYYRIYILLEAVLIILVIYYFTRPFLITRKMKMKEFGSLLINLIPLVYLSLFVSIISNLLGYTNLSDLTLKIIVIGTVLTLIFYALLLLASGLVIGALHLAFSNRVDFNIDRKILIEKRSIQFIQLGIGIWWLSFFLAMVDLKSSFVEWINEFLMVNYNVGSLNFTLNEVFSFLVILTASFIISGAISMIVDGGALNFLKLPKGIPAAISMVFRYIIIAFGFVLSLSVLGVDLSQFNLMAGALGLGIGFGLQTIISNFVSGLILVFERPILPGDTIEVENLLGNVTDIGVRSSKIRTFDGSEVIVPNNNLISKDLINWTLSDSIRRIEIKIGAAYGSDPNIVLKILIEEALKNEFTITDPPPVALFDQFGDSSLNFRLLVWVHYEKGLISKSNISVGIYNSFKENNIEIPFPQRDIHIKDKEDKK